LIGLAQSLIAGQRGIPSGHGFRRWSSPWRVRGIADGGTCAAIAPGWRYRAVRFGLTETASAPPTYDNASDGSASGRQPDPAPAAVNHGRPAQVIRLVRGRPDSSWLRLRSRVLRTLSWDGACADEAERLPVCRTGAGCTDCLAPSGRSDRSTQSGLWSAPIQRGEHFNFPPALTTTLRSRCELGGVSGRSTRIPGGTGRRLVPCSRLVLNPIAGYNSAAGGKL
jgi:hypothetical protein